MNKEQLIQYYHRFCRWQQAEPRYVNRHEGEVRHCHNCGTEFSDNFCPRCGQRAEVGRVGWRSIRESITLLWGLDSRSLGYTLVQLLVRPGYLVRDYISGHRQVSFPPVKMLVLVCLSVVIFESVFHLENNVISMHFKDEKIDSVIAWINAQKSWATLFYQSLYILPTWLVFRFAPGYPRHTLPEGFFLQVFLSVQSLLLSFLGYWNSDIELWLWLIYMYITYRQLFGYGWWSTLWRFVVVMLLHLGVMATVAATVTVLLLHRDNGSYVYFLVLISAIVLLTAVMLLVTHRINKRAVNQER
ncbi:MAG: DUF3667 domain-containing protein [Prevotella sp.]|nr:DUF3667 domain-containing protein [Prevotella sp.]